MYIFPTYSPKRNLRNYFIRKYLKVLAEKNMQRNVGIRISTWRTEQKNKKKTLWSFFIDGVQLH